MDGWMDGWMSAECKGISRGQRGTARRHFVLPVTCCAWLGCVCRAISLFDCQSDR
ncbi:hypothetical protein BC567DRAFT_223623 [Phyllosticta citribraziliensis]